MDSMLTVSYVLAHDLPLPDKLNYIGSTENWGTAVEVGLSELGVVELLAAGRIW